MFHITNISVILSPLVTTSTEPVITSFPDVSLYFSGITIIFTCQFTIDSSIFDDPNAVVTAQWMKGGNVLTGDSRLNVRAPQRLPGSMIYFGSLDFEFLTQLDSDNYSCDVSVTSNVNSEFITNSSVSTSIMINVEG